MRKCVCTVSVHYPSGVMLKGFPWPFPTMQAAKDFVGEHVTSFKDEGAMLIVIAEEGRGSDRYEVSDIVICEYLGLEWIHANRP